MIYMLLKKKRNIIYTIVISVCMYMAMFTTDTKQPKTFGKGGEETKLLLYALEIRRDLGK